MTRTLTVLVLLAWSLAAVQNPLRPRWARPATVEEGGSGQELSITTTSLPPGEVSTAYSRQLAASGGTAPYTWSESGSSLGSAACGGLSLSSGGVVSGTPTTQGTCSFTAMVTDSDSPANTDTQGLVIVVAGVGGAESAHDYFDAITARNGVDLTLVEICSAATFGDEGACSLRSQTQLDGLGNASQNFVYDFANDPYADKQDAAKMTIVAPEDDIHLQKDALITPFGPYNTGSLTLIWDVYYTTSFLRTACPGGHNNTGTYKAFQLLAGASGTGSIYWETRTQWQDSALVDCADVAIHDNRVYPWEGGDGAPAGVTKDAPFTPTGPGAEAPRSYPLKVNTWTRHIRHIKMSVPGSDAILDPWESEYGVTLTGTWHVMYEWICDEGRDCTPVQFGAPWKIENFGNGNDRDLRAFFVEMDTSSECSSNPEVCPTGDRILYVRNLIVIRDHNLTLDMSDTSIFKRPVR